MNNLLRFFTDPTKQSGVSLELILNAVVDARLTVLADLATEESKEAGEKLKLMSLLQLTDVEDFNDCVADLLSLLLLINIKAKNIRKNVKIPRSNDKNNGK
jgi:hypothetical protein